MNFLLENLSSQQLRRAAAIKEQIQSLKNEISRIFGSSIKPIVPAALKKRRKMSAAARAKISAAVKARWSKVKGKKVTAKQSPKARVTLNAAARAKISIAAKTRWAKAKAAGKKTL